MLSCSFCFLSVYIQILLSEIKDGADLFQDNLYIGLIGRINGIMEFVIYGEQIFLMQKDVRTT